MQQLMIPVVLFLHILMVPSALGMTILPQSNHTFVPDPVVLFSDPDLASEEAGKPGAQPAQNLIESRAGGAADPAPTFELLSAPDGSVTVTARVAPAAAASSLAPYSVFRLTSLDRSIKHCVPFTADVSAPGRLRAHVQHLPLSSYCVQLGCSCQPGRPCRRRPARCRRYELRAGIDMRAWRRASNVTVWRHDDTAAGPAVSVSVQQTGFRSVLPTAPR